MGDTLYIRDAENEINRLNKRIEELEVERINLLKRIPMNLLSEQESIDLENAVHAELEQE